MELSFTKMQGTGNDFVVIDATKKPFSLSTDTIRSLADRRYGIGFDQMLVVQPDETGQADFCYRIFNADGGEVAMCGNGARCFALYVRSHGLTQKDRIRVRTMSGIITPEILSDGTVRVDMGCPNFCPKNVPFNPESFESVSRKDAVLYRTKVSGISFAFGVVSMGNPHAVCLVQREQLPLVGTIGPALQACGAFPEGVNVGLLTVYSLKQTALRVFERGVGATLACGSGASAAFAVAHRAGLLTDQAEFQMRGGRLLMQAGKDGHVLLTGPACEVFEGKISIQGE